ncbi:MAG TPA: SIR2 family protein [Myxococcaceae bacterium]|nr:SIR2 family protein [Myxococcaceae bacterium]
MTPKPPGLLVRYLKQSRCVVFVGAGLSVGAGLPLWTRLLEEVIDHLVSSMPDGDTHQPELRKLVSQGKLLEVADFCKEQLGAAYHQYLTERLRGDKGTVPQTHKALMHLPFSAWVTTNYDKLLERAYSEVKQGFPKTLTHKDTDTLGRLLFDSGPFILKAHGDIDRPETVVLTSRDYSEIIHANPAFNEIFSGLLLTKALLFVGYSLSDPDFRLLMDRQLTHFRGFVPERFALMTGLGRVERDVLWRTARIQVIPYENASGRHEEVLHFLEALQTAVQPAPAAAAPPPQAQTGSYNMASPSPVPVSAATSVPRAGPSTHPPVPAPARIPQQESVPGGGFISKLLNAVMDDSSQPIAFGLPSPEAPAAPAGPPQSAAMPRQAPVLSQRLFIETVEGRLQLRLTDEQSTPLAQGLVPEALNARVFQALAREGQGAQSHAHLYEELGQLFSQHLPPEVLKVLGAPGAAQQAPLVLRTAAELAHFPWELLPVGDKPLSLVRKVVRAPVGVASQARGTPAVREAPRILLVEGRRHRGGSAARELERLVTVYQAMPEASCTVLSGAEATFDNVMKQLDEALPDLLYFTGDVGQADGELFLDLAGEVELSLGALRSVLNRGQLPLLVMNAPSAAFAPYAFGVLPASTGYQRLSMLRSQAAIFDGRPGFMELATQAGVGAFVGAFDMPGPEVSSAFMFALHHALVLRMPIAEAFRHALREVHARFPEEPTALSYVLSGDGGLWLHKPG